MDAANFNALVNNLRPEIARLTDSEKKELADAVGLVPPPSPGTSRYLWLGVVSSFCFVLLLAAIAIVYAVFNKEKAAETAAKPELLLAVFTAATGFLAGLFAPSPK